MSYSAHKYLHFNTSVESWSRATVDVLVRMCATVMLLFLHVDAAGSSEWIVLAAVLMIAPDCYEVPMTRQTVVPSWSHPNCTDTCALIVRWLSNVCELMEHT